MTCKPFPCLRERAKFFKFFSKTCKISSKVSSIKVSVAQIPKERNISP